MTISVIGSGAFGTALAIALSKDGNDVLLFSRNKEEANQIEKTRKSGHRLPGFDLPPSLRVTSDKEQLESSICLLAIPMQQMSAALVDLDLPIPVFVACSKGVDRKTGLGSVRTIQANKPSAEAAILTGPSFALDIAAGLPTALVLAAGTDKVATTLQTKLTRPTLRLYRTDDVIGAELGGALKNVIALAAGITIGAGLGDSARASVVARGFAEISRYASAKGARQETLTGLSGLGDLVLTCTSEKSRNFTAGVAIGSGHDSHGNTTEGLWTAEPVAEDAKRLGIEVPLITTVAEVVSGRLDIKDAIAALLSRPTGKE